MVSKKDCSFFRVFTNQHICHERPPGAKDPYQVNYDSAERMPSEDGVSYSPPLRQTPNEPASAWSADAYKKPDPAAPATTPAPSEPVIATTEPPAPPAEEKPVAPSSAPKPVKKKAQAKVAHAKPVKKPSPGQVASVP
jgi:hypothetical protein